MRADQSGWAGPTSLAAPACAAQRAPPCEPAKRPQASSLQPAASLTSQPTMARLCCHVLICLLAVDLASQLVLSVAERSVSRYHPGFPIGRGKLEALAVIGCACIMSIASLEVAQFAAIDLYAGFVKGAMAGVGC